MAKKTDEKAVKKQGVREIFTRNLNLAVEKMGWSQSEFGRRLKLKSEQMGARRYLKGEVNITFDGFDRIEEALKIPIAKLFERDGSAFATNLETTNTLRAAQEMIKKITPVLSKLNPEGLTEEFSPAPKEKFADFINRFHQGRGVTAHFFALLEKEAPPEELNVEYLREVAVTVLSEGGTQAKRARKVLAEMLTRDDE